MSQQKRKASHPSIKQCFCSESKKVYCCYPARKCKRQ